MSQRHEEVERDYPEILGFGATAVDDLLYVDHYPPAESKVRVSRRQRECGGLTATALVAASRLGHRCAYVGMLGDDELSGFVIERLEREGVDMTHRAPRLDASPGYSTIVVDTTASARTVFSHVGGKMGADPDWPDVDLIERAKVLLIDHHGIAGNVRAVQIARDSGTEVVADFERHPGDDAFDELLTQVGHLIVPERFALSQTGNATPSDAAITLAGKGQTVVVTSGAEGCWAVGPGEKEARHFAAHQVEAIDTTGCGDVFHGAYAAGLCRGMDLASRVRYASAVAALKATKHGGQAGCPTEEEVARFLAERGQ